MFFFNQDRKWMEMKRNQFVRRNFSASYSFPALYLLQTHQCHDWVTTLSENNLAYVVSTLWAPISCVCDVRQKSLILDKKLDLKWNENMATGKKQDFPLFQSICDTHLM